MEPVEEVPKRWLWEVKAAAKLGYLSRAERLPAAGGRSQRKHGHF